MIDAMFNLFFGCRHRRLTRPITPVHKPTMPAGDTYVVCLECGKQFRYDAQNMRLGSPVQLGFTGASERATSDIQNYSRSN